MSANPKISIQEPSVMPTPIEAEIIPGTLAVVPDPIIIDRRQGGDDVEIVWTCRDKSKDFEVVFENNRSPFKGSKFDKKNNHSGKITGQASGANGSYKYSVTMDGQTQDPTVIIRP